MVEKKQEINNQDNKNDKEKNDKRKKKNNNLVSVLFIIGVLIATVLMFTVYLQDDKEDDSNNDAKDSSISTINTDDNNDGAQPGNNDTDADRKEDNSSGDDSEEEIPDDKEFSDASIPKKKKVDNPSPTVPKPDLHSVAPGELESSVDDYNPKQAEVGTSANIALKGLFDISLNKDENYDKASKKILKTHGTKRAQDMGFKKWYDDGDHSLAWDSEKALGSRIVTSPELKDKEWWANDILRMRWKVSQTVISKNSSYKLEPFTVDTYMKYDKGGWYLDTYTFPDGSHPQLY